MLPRLLLTAFALLPALPGVSAGPPARPNVVLIISDDQGFNDIGWNNPAVKTPNLERLASQGVRFDRFYANPICSVTRAAVMTGIATVRTGVNNSTGLELKYRILPQAFHDAGYQTWIFGKWHLGGTEDNVYAGVEYTPNRRGFDYFYGHLHGAVDYRTHERKDLGKLDWQRNGKPVVEAGFSTDLLADDAIRMLKRRDTERPFLLYLPFNAVHGPLQPPPSAPGLSKRDRRELLLANLAHMDAAIGRLLAAIDHEGLERNTLVMFFSDNGGQLSQGASNAPLRDEKGTTFEGGIRVPAAMRWTGVLKPGVSQQFFCVMDVFPTLCGATGVTTGVNTPIDGINLWPDLHAGEIRKHPPFVMGNKDNAVIAEPWKLVVPPRGEAPPMLFNLIDDPGEKIDLAAKHPDTVDALLREIPPNAGGGRKGGPKPGMKGRTPGDGKRGGTDKKPKRPEDVIKQG